MSVHPVCDEFGAIFERHVLGQATAAEAALFSSHALGCARCTAALRGVQAFDATFGPPPAPQTQTPPASRLWRGVHPGLVAGISLALILAGGALTWRAVTRVNRTARVIRGHGGTLSAHAAVNPDGGLRIRWRPVPGTLVYHVQIAGSKGAEISKDTSTPQISLSLSEATSLGDLDVTVDAESAFGEHVSRATTIDLSESRR